MRSGDTASGSACLYISDVHKLAQNDCLLLRQLTALFPGLKWFIVGRSPYRLLRGRLREIWTGDHITAPEQSSDEVKMLPIRVINTGAAQALKHVTHKGLYLPRGSKPLPLTWRQPVTFSLLMYEGRSGHVLKPWRKIATFLLQKPLRPFSCNFFCLRLGSEQIHLLSSGYMMGYG